MTDGLRIASTATQRFPDCLDLWEMRLALLLKSHEDGPVTPVTVEVFQEAIQRFPGSIRLAEEYIQFLKLQHTHKALNDEELWTEIEVSFLGVWCN
jgi:hypothetical protein